MARTSSERKETLKAKTRTQNKSAAAPKTGQHSAVIQAYGTRFALPIGLPDGAAEQSTTALNRVLADVMTMRDLYKKSHWQTSGATFYQLHLLFDKHYEEQAALVDKIAERIQILGGISVAMAQDVADLTSIERPPTGREEVPVQLSRLLKGHEIILLECRRFAKEAAEIGDDGTNDLLVSDIIRLNEMQVWFIAEHLVALSAVEAKDMQ